MRACATWSVASKIAIPRSLSAFTQGTYMRFISLTLLVLLSTSLSGQRDHRSGIHTEDMDPTCQPCTDFWRYVNGGWLDKNPIPARSSSWGPMTVLTEAN